MNALSTFFQGNLRHFGKRRSKYNRRRLRQPDRRQRSMRAGLEGLEERLMLARDLLIADPVTDSIQRFDGETGALIGPFVPSGSAGLVDPHDPTFGPDGNLYVFSGNGTAAPQILRYDGDTGAAVGTGVFIDTGVGGFAGGSAMEFSPDGNLYVAPNAPGGVQRFDGTTGAFTGVAVSASLTRATGLQFGQDGDLYVFNSDGSATNTSDRILRFDPGTGALVEQLVAPGTITNAFDFTFGPDNHIYVDEFAVSAIRRFSGTTGEPLDTFNQPTELIESPIFDTEFGSDGNAYAATAERILRFDGETGDLIDTFVEGVGGTITFFPPEGPPADLDVTLVTIPPGALFGDGEMLSISYTVQNNSADPAPVDEWVDVVYLSQDEIFDPFDIEVGRMTHTGGLAGGTSYSETLTVDTPEVLPGEYHVVVVADRRGQSPDANRLNNIKITPQQMTVLPKADAVDPTGTLALGRSLSAWTTADLASNELTITYTVFNLTVDYVGDVAFETTLQPGVQFDSASIAPDISGQTLSWDFGRLGPLGTASVDVTVTLDNPIPLVLDEGANAAGTVNFTEQVADDAPSATLRTDAIDPNLLAATIDADADDFFIRAKAAELNQDMNAIFAFMTQQVGYESYQGSLRGARGTLWSEAGNALDQASLLVALLRASGVPAQYAAGVLPDALAQELILSMFPEPLLVTGFVPDGAELSDPANDPQLLAETRAHVWVQLDVGAGLQDADPTFGGAAIGEAFAAVDATFDEVPADQRHQVTLRLLREMFIQANSLFSAGSASLDVANVLDVTFNTVELVGKPLTIGQFVQSFTPPSLLISATTNTYSPFIAVGDYAQPTSEDILIRGTDFQEVITNFPFGTQILTGLFLEIDLSGPDGPTETFERALVDLIGFDVRQNGGTPNLIFDPAQPTLSSFDLFTVNTVNLLPNLFHLPAAAPLALEFAQLQREVDRASGGANDAGAAELSRLHRFVIAQTRLMAANFFGTSDLFLERLSTTSLVKAYFDRPRIVITGSRLVPEGETQATPTFDIDLRRDTIRALAYPGQNVSVLPVFRFVRGNMESVVETGVLEFATGGQDGPAIVSTAAVFSAAVALNIPILLLTSENAAELEGLDISAEAKARITVALQSGRVVQVPASSVPIGGGEHIAWYEIDPDTGETIGVTEDGGHQAITEYAAIVVAVASFILVVNVFLGRVIGPPPQCYAPGANFKECLGDNIVSEWNKYWSQADDFINNANPLLDFSRFRLLCLKVLPWQRLCSARRPSLLIRRCPIS